MSNAPGAFGHIVSDAARRMADHVNLAAHAGDRGKWLAIRLSDGGSDGVVYDDRPSAVRHQLHETQCLYVRVPMGPDMTYGAAQSFLNTARKAYDAGFRFSEPTPTRKVTLP